MQNVGLKRVHLLESEESFSHPVICFNESKTTSPDQVYSDFREMHRLSGDRPFFVLADLTKADPPNLQVRRALSSAFREFNSDNFIGAYIHMGKSKFLLVAAKFVFGLIGKQKFHWFDSREEAIDAIPKNRTRN